MLGKNSKLIKENEIPIRVKTKIGFINIFPIRLILIDNVAIKTSYNLFPIISTKKPKRGSNENITRN